MLCGYLKQVCRSITVQQLIDILNTCKNKDAIIKLSEMTNFFIHFDQEGQFIDFSKSPMTNKYGNPGVDCTGCNRYSKEEKRCMCDGKDCLNADMMVDTDKFDNCRICENSCSKDTKTEAPTIEIKNSKYDLSNYSINGTEQVDEGTDNLAKIVPLKEEKKEQIKSKDIQDVVDKAIINTLTKMINGIQGE